MVFKYLVVLIGLQCYQPAVGQDLMAERMSACTTCHGKEGRAAPDGFYPRIAGKPAEYLYAQLKHFQQRRRSYDPMTHMVKNLSDAYLREIAAYFSALDVPYPPPLPVAASIKELVRGEQLVKRGDQPLGIPACNQCHGEQMTGMLPATPGLLGLPRDYINSQIGSWKEGTRKSAAPNCMNKIAKQLSAEDLSAVAGYLAAQPVPANSKPVVMKIVSIAEKCDW
jgi:cytochrome c553